MTDVAASDEEEEADERAPPFRFLGLRMDNCRFVDVRLSQANYSNLSSLGLPDQFIEDMKTLKYNSKGNQSLIKLVLDEITHYFRRGELSDGWFEKYFAALENAEASDRISKGIY